MTVKANATITLIRVNDGTNGKDGTSVKITAKSVTYQASTSGTTTPTGTWLANPPVVGKGQYLWTKTVVTYSDGNSTTAYSVAYQGTNGSNGQNGSPGRGVKSTEVTYQIWNNGTSTPNGTWQATVPDTTSDKPYLWTRTVITYTDNTKSTSYSVGSTLKGVNVGGRNLIKDTSTAKVNANWKQNGWKGTFETSEKQIYKLVANAGWHVARYVGLTDYIGKTVTISFYGKCLSDETTSTDNWGIFITNATGTNPYATYVLEDRPEKDIWIFYKYTCVLNSDGQIGIGCFCATENESLKTTWLIKNLKLELGNIATDWTPAPEDVDEGINNAQSSADKANTNASNAQSAANNAQSSADNASAKADQAKADADDAIKNYQDAINKAKDAQISADKATALANGAQQGVSNIEQVVKIDTQGVRIYEKENSKTYVHQKSDGSHFYTNNEENGVVGPDSRMNNLAVNDYFMSASHRMEYGYVLNQDASVFYHIGKLKKVVQ